MNCNLSRFRQLLIVLLVLPMISVFSMNSLAASWSCTYTGSLYDSLALSVTEASNGDFMLVGVQDSSGINGFATAWRFAGDGSCQLIGGNGYFMEQQSVARSVITKADGGFLIGGDLPGSGEIFLVELSPSNATLREQRFEGIGGANIYGGFVQETSDGGVIMVGDRLGDLVEERKVYVRKLDSAWNTLWEVEHTIPDFNAFVSSMSIASDGTILVGGTLNWAQGGGGFIYSAFIQAFSPDGVPGVMYDFGAQSPYSRGADVGEKQDNSYFLVGDSKQNQYAPQKASIGVISSLGAYQWSRLVGMENCDALSGGKPTLDNGFVVVAQCLDSGLNRILGVAKLGPMGYGQWGSAYSMPGRHVWGRDIIVTQQQTYLAIGYSWDTSATTLDSLVLYHVDPTDTDRQTIRHH